MNPLRRTVTLGLVLAGTTACDRGARAERALEAILAARQARLEQAVASPDSLKPDAPLARWILPEHMGEISGLALTSDGRLFTHGDEFGKIYEIDYRRGVLVKEFSLGPPLVPADFEAIAVVRDTLVMLTSRGVLYRFLEGEDGAGVSYSTEDTGLGTTCEFEGMAFDSSANTLVLACKNVEDGGRNDAMLLYLWPLDRDTSAMAPLPAQIPVPLAAIVGTLGWPKIEPSDITVNPFNGNYRVIASGQQALFEVTPRGEVVFSRTLPSGHAQPEGLAMTKDLMLISDEAVAGPAVITVYRRQE
jgi:hypothetical protein